MIHDAKYYREQGERAQRLADMLFEGAARDTLEHFAKDYLEMAEDLERGAKEVRHPELLREREREKVAGSFPELHHHAA